MTILTPLAERFWAKVDKTDGCWEWRAYVAKDGYGRINAGRRGAGSLLAHRVAYELLVGPVPDGLTLDHLCRVRHCVNPAHLEPVTPRVNTLRGNSAAARHAATDLCKYGHPKEVIRGNGQRGCRTCKREHDRRSRAKRQAA